MKKIGSLSYLTMMLIILQSFSMVANSFDIHSVEVPSLQHEHSHILPHDSISNSQHNAADCHICGHCSGSHAPVLTPCTTLINHSGHAIQHSYYLMNKTSSPIHPWLRPPKKA